MKLSKTIQFLIFIAVYKDTTDFMYYFISHGLTNYSSIFFYVCGFVGVSLLSVIKTVLFVLVQTFSFSAIALWYYYNLEDGDE